MQLAPIEEHVGEQIRAAVEEAARGVLLHVGDELEEVVAAPARLPISLHLDTEHLAARALPEQIDSALLEARILLDIVDLRALDIPEKETANQTDRPVGGVPH